MICTRSALQRLPPFPFEQNTQCFHMHLFFRVLWAAKIHDRRYRQRQQGCMLHWLYTFHVKRQKPTQKPKLSVLLSRGHSDLSWLLSWLHCISGEANGSYLPSIKMCPSITNYPSEGLASFPLSILYTVCILQEYIKILSPALMQTEQNKSR